MENEVIFLLDTNVWLERLLEQKQSDAVEDLLNHSLSENISISDFSLHSIGVILTKLNRFSLYFNFFKICS